MLITCKIIKIVDIIPKINLLRGVQAYNFGNFHYEIWVEGEGQDTSRLFRVVHAHNFTDVRPRSKNGAKHQNLNQYLEIELWFWHHSKKQAI